MGEGEAINFAVALNELEIFLSDIPDQTVRNEGKECNGQVLEENRSSNDDGLVVLGDRDRDGVADISVYTPDNPAGMNC